MTNVAVIGAGALGLMAIKTLKEDGFNVTGFEARSYVGGLWKDSVDSTLSVVSTTTFNSSKFRSAISDFPFADDVDDFPTAPQMLKYLTDYAEHFELVELVRLETKVLGLERVEGRWEMAVQTRDRPVEVKQFDKVVVATGSFFKPKFKRFPGQQNFEGEVIHSIDFHGPEAYKDKTVLILGIHASAQDVAVSLRGAAKKVYMSHRGGLVLIPQYMADGATYDQAGSLRFILIQTFMMTWLPRLWTWIFDKLLGSISRKSFNVKPEWGLLPAPSMAVSTPLVGDKLYSLLTSGFATPVKEAQEVIGPKSVLFVDGTINHDIDAIIQCTGYDFDIPFLAPNSPYQPYPVPGDAPYLYRNIFPLDSDPAIRNSLAFLGQGATAFPGFSQFELIAQSISQIWQGKHHLPSLQEMKKWHADNLAWRARHIALYGSSSTFYVAMLPFSEHFRWIDATAGTGIYATFDWAWFNPRSWALWWSDPQLYRACMGGLFTPAIWRLFECGGRKAWSGAREQVFRDNDAALKQKESRLKSLNEKGESTVNVTGVGDGDGDMRDQQKKNL